MKRILLLLTAAGMLLGSTPAMAVFGFGVHGGVDNITVNSFDEVFSLDDGTAVTLKREEISSPIMFGGQFVLDALPFIDLELSADASFKKYNVTYITTVKTVEEEATFGRIGLYATVKKNLVSFPPVVNTFSVYAGVGAGIHLMTPVVGRKLIQKELKNAADALKPDDITDRLTRVGGNVLLGIRLKPPVLPYALNADAKYTFMGAGDYDEPKSFLSIYLSVSMQF